MHPFVILYTNALRVALAALAVRHLLKRDYQPAGSAAAAVALTYLPAVLDRLVSYRLDPVGNLLYNTIIAMSIYLGSSLKFYDRFAWWDYAIHCLSGGLFVSMGVALTVRTVSLPRLPVLIFSFTLSLSLHLIWEILEYLGDCLFHSDNQRWQKRHPDRNHQPRWAMQPPGLVDTMNDSIICVLGTVFACVVWWFFW